MLYLVSIRAWVEDLHIKNGTGPKTLFSSRHIELNFFEVYIMYLDQNRQNLPYRTQEKKVAGLFLILRLYWKNERL